MFMDFFFEETSNRFFLVREYKIYSKIYSLIGAWNIQKIYSMQLSSISMKSMFMDSYLCSLRKEPGDEALLFMLSCATVIFTR